MTAKVSCHVKTLPNEIKTFEAFGHHGLRVNLMGVNTAEHHFSLFPSKTASWLNLPVCEVVHNPVSVLLVQFGPAPFGDIKLASKCLGEPLRHDLGQQVLNALTPVTRSSNTLEMSLASSQFTQIGSPGCQ